MSRDKAEIATVVQGYLDGLYQCSVEHIVEAFHPKAILAELSSEHTLCSNLGEYCAEIKRTVSPASRAEVRREWILSIDLFCPASALVVLADGGARVAYTQVLIVVKNLGRWRIVTSVLSQVDDR